MLITRSETRTPPAAWDSLVVTGRARAAIRRATREAAKAQYGQLGRQDLEKALDAMGIKPVAEEKFNIGDTDMTSQLLRAKAADADVILTYAIGPELAQIANGMGKLGWKLPLIGSWTLKAVSQGK